MSHNPALELASAIQSASIKRNPSPHHDINPSTAASEKIAAHIIPSNDDDLSDLGAADDDDASTIPSDIIRPRPRTRSFPPLPDFRFEQSYLASIKTAKTNTQVILITVRDQVLLPLAQGVLWNMAMFGWRFWNRDTKFRGRSLGARVRKWWWGVNNWAIPREEAVQRQERAVGEAKEVSLFQKLMQSMRGGLG